MMTSRLFGLLEYGCVGPTSQLNMTTLGVVPVHIYDPVARVSDLWGQLGRSIRVGRFHELTADGTVGAAVAVQQVVSQTRRVRQAEEVLEFICGETCVLCSFPQVNNGPWQPLFGHLPLKYPLLQGTWVEVIQIHTLNYKSATCWIFWLIMSFLGVSRYRYQYRTRDQLF